MTYSYPDHVVNMYELLYDFSLSSSSKNKHCFLLQSENNGFKTHCSYIAEVTQMQVN